MQKKMVLFTPIQIRQIYHIGANYIIMVIMPFRNHKGIELAYGYDTKWV